MLVDGLRQQLPKSPRNPRHGAISKTRNPPFNQSDGRVSLAKSTFNWIWVLNRPAICELVSDLSCEMQPFTWNSANSRAFFMLHVVTLPVHWTHRSARVHPSFGGSGPRKEWRHAWIKIAGSTRWSREASTLGIQWDHRRLPQSWGSCQYDTIIYDLMMWIYVATQGYIQYCHKYIHWSSITHHKHPQAMFSNVLFVDLEALDYPGDPAELAGQVCKAPTLLTRAGALWQCCFDLFMFHVAFQWSSGVRMTQLKSNWCMKNDERKWG